MKINAKTLDDSCLTTRELLRKAYGFDITLLSKRKNNKSIIEQLNLEMVKQFEVFERIYQLFGEDEIFNNLTMTNINNGWWLISSMTDEEKDLFRVNKKIDFDLIDSSFRLYAIGKMPPFKKKMILDFYENFWNAYYKNLPLLNNYNDDDLLNSINLNCNDTHRDNHYVGQYNRSKIDSYFYIDVHNMFGVKKIDGKSFFVLNPHTPNFIYLDISKIQNEIIDLLRKNIEEKNVVGDETEEIKKFNNVLNENIKITLRNHWDMEGSKISFHNIQSSENKQKIINITFEKDMIEKLIRDILSGKMIYLQNNSKKSSYLNSFESEYAECAKAYDNVHGFESKSKDRDYIKKIFDQIIKKNDIHNFYDKPYSKYEIEQIDLNDKKIFIEYDTRINNKIRIDRIYYPFDFEMAFEVFFDSKGRTYLNKFTEYKETAINRSIESSDAQSSILPQYVFGKLHLSCLIDLISMPDEYCSFINFLTYAINKNKN